MSHLKQHPEPTSADQQPARDEGWTITPRAITTVATIIGILYSLQAPIRYVLAIGSSVDGLSARVTALEAIVAHDEQRAASTEARAAELSARAATRPR